MKSVIFGFILTAALASGCTPEFLQVDASLTSPAETKAKGAPVTADDVNEKNAADIGKRLNDEIQKDEQSSRGNAMERSKLAIP
jgi:hypothetical protein